MSIKKWTALFPHKTYIRSFVSISKEHNSSFVQHIFIFILKNNPYPKLNPRDKGYHNILTWIVLFSPRNVYLSFIQIQQQNK